MTDPKPQQPENAPTVIVPTVLECEAQIAWHAAQLAKFRRLAKALKSFHGDESTEGE